MIDLIKYIYKCKQKRLEQISDQMSKHYVFQSKEYKDKKIDLNYVTWIEVACPDISYNQAIKVYALYLKYKNNNLEEKVHYLNKQIKRFKRMHDLTDF